MNVVLHYWFTRLSNPMTQVQQHRKVLLHYWFTRLSNISESLKERQHVLLHYWFTRLSNQQNVRQWSRQVLLHYWFTRLSNGRGAGVHPGWFYYITGLQGSQTRERPGTASEKFYYITGLQGSQTSNLLVLSEPKPCGTRCNSYTLLSNIV